MREWSGRSAFILSGANAIRKDQAYDLTMARGTRIRLDLAYQQIPHLFS